MYSANVSDCKRISRSTGGNKISWKKICTIWNYTIYIYIFFLQLDSNRHVIHRTCICVAQSGEACKHIYGLIHRLNNDRGVSKTSVEQEWGKPSVCTFGKRGIFQGLYGCRIISSKKAGRGCTSLQFGTLKILKDGIVLLKKSSGRIMCRRKSACVLLFLKSLWRNAKLQSLVNALRCALWIC